jgi:DNA-binding transcriptional ArsR family regulator
MSASFKASQEAAFRRVVREVIRDSYMSKGEQAVTLAVVNLWLHHRNGPKGHIHPGRERLARSAKVSVRTVASTLAKLREGGVLIVVARPRGEGQKPTQYRVNLIEIFRFCGADLPAWMEGNLTPFSGGSGGQNCTPDCTPLAHHWRAEIAHSLTDVGNAFPKRLKVVGGRDA